jgi:hypothetical protein
MSDGNFNPREHLRMLRGKGGESEYLEVKWRLVWLRAEHPDAQIATQLHAGGVEEGHAVFRANVTIPAGGSASGWGSETARDFGDFLEKAETKALGRALAALGYGTQFAPELDEGDRIADSPVDRKPTPRAGTTPGREPAPRRSERPTDRPAVPSAAGPPSAVTPAEEARLMGRLDKVDAHYNGGDGAGEAKPTKRAPTVAEALAAAGNETLSAKARQYAAVRGLEACPTLDECADYYLKVLPLAPEREALEAAYQARNEALRLESGLRF